MSGRIRVLLVEDSAEDAELVLRALAEVGAEVQAERVASAQALRDALDRGPWQIVLSDWTLPGFGGREALAVLRESDPDTPFVLVSGKIGEEAAVAMMRAGAADYVQKDHLYRLAPVVVREVLECERRQKDRRELARQQAELDLHVRQLDCLVRISSLLFSAGPDWDEALDRLVRVLPTCLPPGSGALARLELEGCVHGEPAHPLPPAVAEAIVTLDGRALGCLSLHASGPAPACGAEALQRLVEAVAERIAETLQRRRSVQELGRREAYFRALIEGGSDSVVLIDREGILLYVSPPFETLLGRPAAELVGTDALDLVDPQQREDLGAFLREGVQSGRFLAAAQVRARHRDGTWRELETTGANLLGDPAVGAILLLSRDVTDRRRLEQQLRQSQKMEALGRLAGGIAHDFNNLLTVIGGNAALLLEDLPHGDPRAMVTAEVRDAARHGTALTRQLLSFSRRQEVRPRVLDLNATVRGVEAMLRRVLGEDLCLETSLTPVPVGVLADPVQVEQVLLNLAINAREAMPGGGRLEIGTARDGPWVRLSVTDDGPGMPPETLARIFEPFYTTKTQGTGLGLATVYGIMEQCGGRASVESALGKGTRFDLLFPLTDGTVSVEREPADELQAAAGSETVLVAEDDPAIRKLVGWVLGRAGYRVLVAPCGSEALTLAASHEGEIHLLVTDMVMPGMTGREVLHRLRAARPHLRAVFTSGHPAEELGLELQQSSFLPKPFTPEHLLTAVRRCLDAPRAGIDLARVG